MWGPPQKNKAQGLWHRWHTSQTSALLWQTTQMSQTADAQLKIAQPCSRSETLSYMNLAQRGVWERMRRGSALNVALLGCRVVKCIKKPSVVWGVIWDMSCLSAWVAKTKWKAVSSKLGYVQETNISVMPENLSRSWSGLSRESDRSSSLLFEIWALRPREACSSHQEGLQDFL